MAASIVEGMCALECVCCMSIHSCIFHSEAVHRARGNTVAALLASEPGNRNSSHIALATEEHRAQQDMACMHGRHLLTFVKVMDVVPVEQILRRRFRFR